jgi:hypothetical protein
VPGVGARAARVSVAGGPRPSVYGSAGRRPRVCA